MDIQTALTVGEGRGTERSPRDPLTGYHPAKPPGAGTGRRVSCRLKVQELMDRHCRLQLPSVRAPPGP